MKRVLVFGTFDLIHPGHVRFLKAARRRGDHLTVVVARDESVRKEKGRRPTFTLKERMEILHGIRWVDHVVAGDRVGEWSVIQRIKPDVICVGYDQDPHHPALRLLRTKPRITQLPKFRARRHKSSLIKKRIRTTEEYERTNRS